VILAEQTSQSNACEKSAMRIKGGYADDIKRQLKEKA
jgi:hypothetical protein